MKPAPSWRFTLEYLGAANGEMQARGRADDRSERGERGVFSEVELDAMDIAYGAGVTVSDFVDEVLRRREACGPTYAGAAR